MAFINKNYKISKLMMKYHNLVLCGKIKINLCL